MSVKNFIKKLLTRASIYFTCITAVYIAISAMLSVSDDSLVLIDAKRLVLFLVFSLLLSAANSLLSLERLSAALRIFLHYNITIFAFYVCFMLTQNMRASVVIVGLAIFTVIYFAITGIVAAFKSRYRKNLEKAQKYQKQYSKRA